MAGEDVAARISQLLQGPAGGLQGFFAKPINQGAQAFTSTVVGIATGKIGGISLGRDVQSFVTRQMDYERQRLSQLRSDGDQVMAQLAAQAHQAIAQAAASIQHSVGGFLGHGLGSISGGGPGHEL